MSNGCVDHLEFVGRACEDCNLQVDKYGNTESQFDNCCYPDCGCDGSRLCMAPSGASELSCDSNIEGMWSGKTSKQRSGVFALIDFVNKEKP